MFYWETTLKIPAIYAISDWPTEVTDIGLLSLANNEGIIGADKLWEPQKFRLCSKTSPNKFCKTGVAKY